MSSPVIKNSTVRFDRLLHCGGVLVTVLCSTAGFEWLYRPAATQMDALAVRIDQLQQQLKNAPAARREHERLSQRIAAIQDRIDAIDSRVPKNPDETLFLKQLSEIAQREGVKTGNFIPGQPVRKNGYAQMELSITGEGSFQSICSFFDQLAKTGRLSKVRDVDIRSSDLTGSYPLEATMVIYFGLNRADATAEEVDRG